ncbi:uncharacterized protein [Zea mays]|uniref:uncharacterized protein n=1 Tax=Zea mays TaxID=4577 RepID=UPI0009AAB5B3|nr:uncharacterized protein LOC103638697 [Zea mays]|eukprot:XP_020400245.1 uncharacterized protein LOC103638697 [Zea mays]
MEGEVKSGGGNTQWTSSQSTFVQNFLANLVANGTKTSTGFKKVHLNDIEKKYTRINYLKNLSASLWDEDQFIVSLDHEHYTNHFEDERNKGDDEFINKPLPYYGNLATIFGNSVASGCFAKTSNDPLAVDDGENVQKEGCIATSSAVHENDTASTSATKPSKKAKREENGTEFLVEAFQHATQTLASAIKEAANKPLPAGLFEAVDNIPGFEIAHKSKYYSHLVSNPDIAHAFMDVPLLYKVSMITDFVNEKF